MNRQLVAMYCRCAMGALIMACASAVACAAGEMAGPLDQAAAAKLPGSAPTVQPAQEAAVHASADDDGRIGAAISKGVALLLAMQEGEPRAEWPYEGVYRVQGQIPIGYRVGGTAIVAMALIEAPGYEGDAECQAAVRRALQFIIGALDHPLMGPEVQARYDVRGWGYTYALQLVLVLIDRHQVPEDLSNACTDAVRVLIDRINATEIVETGGWNYSRRAGFDKPSPSSAFMTAPTLQALFRARQQGFAVDPEVISRGITALERGRMESGAFAYAGAGATARDGLPGAIGRAVAAETTLLLCGRSSQDRVRAAVNAFFEHWNELEKRRAQPGTHAAPFGVAPYYFFYAHYFAAQAIEQLPEAERPEYRRRLAELLFNVQQPEGTWNDRVFPRSASFGTAMSMLALRMPTAPPRARWDAPPATAPDDAPVPSVTLPTAE